MWVLRWAAFYTRGLPREVANDRRDELASDLFEHSKSAGRTPRERRALASEIGMRAVFGMGADLSWRGQQLRRERSGQAAISPRRQRSGAQRTSTAVYVLAAVMIVASLSGAVRATLNVSAFSSPGAPAVLLSCGVLACLAVFLFSRPGSRLLGGIGLAVLAFPIGWTLSMALPSISAHASQLYAALMEPLLDLLPPLLGLGTMLVPSMLVAACFLIGTIRTRPQAGQTPRQESDPGLVG
ncbi:hypothetical protein B7R21_18555 [Subtercola boreus]|uniref:Uncharacterized protein n=1 Tax=Subtercola boreus TaxID=120213 RepID=A0A3E0VAA2_9MICO|nr:hypothetical protein B7R21_18555 [Subtercola boreus]